MGVWTLDLLGNTAHASARRTVPYRPYPRTRAAVQKVNGESSFSERRSCFVAEPAGRALGAEMRREALLGAALTGGAGAAGIVISSSAGTDATVVAIVTGGGGISTTCNALAGGVAVNCRDATRRLPKMNQASGKVSSSSATKAISERVGARRGLALLATVGASELGGNVLAVLASPTTVMSILRMPEMPEMCSTRGGGHDLRAMSGSVERDSHFFSTETPHASSVIP